MNELLNLLNSMPTEQQKLLATACKTSVGYLRKACSAGQKLGPELCVALERESAGAISRQALRPDDWSLIWPELKSDGVRRNIVEQGHDAVGGSVICSGMCPG